MILRKLANNIENLIEEGLKVRKLKGGCSSVFAFTNCCVDAIICHHFACLTDWLWASGKTDILQSEQLSLSMCIFTAVDTAINCVSSCN